MVSLSISLTNRVCDWIIIITCGILSAYYSKLAIETPYAQYEVAEEAPLGVQCKEDTVSFVVLNIVGVGIWLLIFVLNLLIISFYHHSAVKQQTKQTLVKFEVLLRSAAMSIAMTYVTTEAIKVYVPRARPCYYDMAQSGNEIGAMKSFPSGHTSFAFSVFFLLTLYLMNALLSSRKIIRMALNPNAAKKGKERTNDAGGKSTMKGIKMDQVIDVHNGDAYLFLWLFLRLKRCEILGLIIAIVPTVISLGIGCSRITDFRHRYSDVVTGAIIGMVFASLSFAYYKAEFYDGYRYDAKKILTDDDENDMC